MDKFIFFLKGNFIFSKFKSFRFFFDMVFLLLNMVILWLVLFLSKVVFWIVEVCLFKYNDVM